MLMIPGWCGRQAVIQLCLAILLPAITTGAATVTARTNLLGRTPEIIAYNAGHFFPGSNTREWWRYAGVNGARLFINASEIEPEDDLAGRGDGVTDAVGFLARRAALRADPLNTNYINWPVFSNRYENITLSGANKIRLNYACSQLRQLGIQILANLTMSQSSFTINSTNDWAGKWELWQHFYAQAFYLGSRFDVQRFQMFNEPNHPNANGLTPEDYLQRLQLAADAAQCALADANRLCRKTLTPVLLAPVTSGSADGSYPGWGDLAITNRHRNFLGQWDTNFSLLQRYDYHQYNSSPANFGSDLAALQNLLNAALPPGTSLPVTISEFNVHTAGTFDTLSETLDSPTKFARLGSIAVNLARNGASELYCFKFTQTFETTIKKNGMHYADNFNAPYNIGGITRAGEVWRLFARAAAPNRDRLDVTRGAGAESLDLLASVGSGNRYRLFSANYSNGAVSLAIELSAWGIPAGNLLLIEEVSENCHGAGRLWTNLPSSLSVSVSQPANTVWLLTACARPAGPPQTVVASEDALVKDGSNRTANYGTSAMLWVKDSSINANARNVAFIKLHLPWFYPPDLQFAVLRAHASSLTGSTSVLAAVYGLTNSAWNQETLTWANAPNLAQNISPGADITNHFVLGVGDSARLLGHLQANGSQTELTLDVADFVRENAGRAITLLLARQPRFSGDNTDGEGMTIVSLEGNAALAPRLEIVRALDSDNDGLSDDAETTVFGTDPANADTDGDRLADGDEIIAGTDPLDPSSCLRFLAPEGNFASGNFHLEWPAVTNRLYRIERSAAAGPGTWETIFLGAGTNSIMRQAELLSTNRAFYRLRVEP